MVYIQEKAGVEKVDMEVKSENMDTIVKEEQEKTTKVTVSSDKSQVEKKENPKVDTKKKEAPFDKELLQASHLQNVILVMLLTYMFLIQFKFCLV